MVIVPVVIVVVINVPLFINIIVISGNTIGIIIIGVEGVIVHVLWHLMTRFKTFNIQQRDYICAVEQYS